MSFEIIKTTQGKDLLIYDDNEFVLKRKNRHENVWSCAFGGHIKSSTCCPAQLRTDLCNSKVFQESSMTSHNHLPNMDRISKRKFMLRLKESAEKCKSVTPSALVNECRNDLSHNTDMTVASDESFYRMVREYCAQFRPYHYHL